MELVATWHLASADLRGSAIAWPELRMDLEHLVWDVLQLANRMGNSVSMGRYRFLGADVQLPKWPE